MAEKKQQALATKAKEAYGKVSPEEYEELLKAARVTTKLKEYLREDWEVGIDEVGQFSVTYMGRCDACNFEFRYQHTQQVWV